MFRLMRLENLNALPKPCDFFDIIGGAGTGGVIALMLGRLRMPIDLAIEKYVLFSREVFSDVKKWSRRGDKFKATVFESGMRAILQSAGFSEDVSMQEDDPLCRSFVVALPSVHMTPRIFRTYEVKANQGYNCLVVEAARATTATPDLFKPVSISSGRVSESFVGAGLGFGNPINFLLEEAAMVFGFSQAVACLVSIGAGHPGHVAWESSNLFGPKIVELLYKLTTNCEDLAKSFGKFYMQMPGLFYRLNVDQGLQRMALDDWNKQGDIKAHTLAYIQDNKVGNELNGGNFLTNFSEKQAPSELVPELLPIVSPPSPLFTGRDDILELLEKYFCKSSTEVKVQQYASSKASIEHFLTLLAQNAKLVNATSAAALIWLCYQKEEWLMIFDNADDPEAAVMAIFLSQAEMMHLKNMQLKIIIKVEKMEPEDSLALFYKASQREEDENEAAEELVQELGYLALAIVQAGSYLLHNQQIQVKRYIENYKKDMSRYMAETSVQTIDKYSLSVFATWNLSYQRLNERAKAILMLCGVLHNSKIPISILERGWKKLANTCEIETQELQSFLQMFVDDNENWSDKLVEKAIDMLRSYSLVEIQGKGVTLLEIHLLVHGWAFKSLSGEMQKKAKQCAQQLFYCLGDEKLEYNDAAQWVLHIQALMHHLNYKCNSYKLGERLGKIFFIAYFWNDAEKLQQQVFVECDKVLGSNDINTIKAMSILATTYWKSGKLKEAEELGQRVVEAMKKAFGSSHSNTIQAMSNLAVIFNRSERLEEAEKLEQEVLESRKNALGSNHPNSIQAMSNLAATFWKAGRLERAEKLQQEVLKVRKDAFGNNHSDTIQAMADLAVTLSNGGKFEEAEKLEQEVLNFRENVFGSSHPDTIRVKSNLAVIFGNERRLEKAEELEKEILNNKTDVFGESHPDTIQAMSNLAATFWKGGKLEDAEKFQQKVFKARTECFGSSHPDTIQAIGNLAATLSIRGRLEEAEKLEQEVLKFRKDAFKCNHPDTIQAMTNLAVTFSRSGKLEEAEKLAQKVLKIREDSFGSRHTDTIQAMSNLATIFWKGRRLAEAEQLEQKILMIRKDIFGDSHPDTIQAMSNLGVTLSNSKKLEEAEKLQQEVLKVREDVFGKSHLDTIQAMSNLAATFWKGGKLEEAEKLEQEVLEIMINLFGRSNSHTIQAMSNLAKTFKSGEKFEEAEKLEQEVLMIQENTFGSKHPDTIQAMSNLAVTFCRVGKLEEAERLEQEVLKFREDVFKKSHPLTIQAMSNLAVTFLKGGKLEQAKKLQQEVLNIRRNAFGNSHPDTLEAMSHLAVTFINSGNLKEAEKLQQEVLKIQREAYGSKHPDTIQAMANLAATFRRGRKWREAEDLERKSA
ncbi:hypothetical protein C0992_006257 [Termitomyces sp. T32_za158]|nr:hypothetical protein C0992_006257 [Termitomyces sp. T32_za158]